MAYCEPYTGYSADYSNVSYSSNEHPSSLYHAGVNPPWPITASASPSFTALSNRVGALEEQLAKTLAEQTETHLVLQCLIRGQADALNKAVGATKFNQSISALRYKLVRAKQANRVLQATLRLVFPILKHDHPCSTINKCQLGTFSNPHHVLRTKIATPPITEDLIDLFTSSESTAVDNSEKDAASSVHALGKEDGANEAYTSDGEEAPHRELATHDSIEVFQDQYVYRFGHVAGGNALNIDTSREQSPNKDTKQVFDLALNMPKSACVLEDTEPHPSLSSLTGQAELPHTHSNEVGHESALTSLNRSFDSSATTVVSDDGDPTNSPSLKPQCRRETAWMGANIFASVIERDGAIRNHQRHTGSQDLRFPNLFRYNLRFNPGRTQRNVHRTVLISGLSSDVTMTSLLEQVRGGLVIEAKLLNTQTITGHKTAWIVFQRETTARAFVKYATQNTITFDGKTVATTMLETPTWPIPSMLQTSIASYNHTRCLEVYNYPRERISPMALKRELRICQAVAWDAIEHAGMRADGVLELRFSSIRYAGQAFGILTRHSNFRQCKTYFTSDPCAQPLPGTIDQNGRLGKEAKNRVANEGAPAVVRGRGFTPRS